MVLDKEIPPWPTKRIHLQTEAERYNADGAPPSFVPRQPQSDSPSDFDLWRQEATENVTNANLSFVIGDEESFRYLKTLFGEFPDLDKAITAMEFPYFYTTSRIYAGLTGASRDSESSGSDTSMSEGSTIDEPLATVSHLENLTHLSITLHTGALTKLALGGYRTIQLEHENVSFVTKRLMDLNEVAHYLHLDDIHLSCENLQVLDIKCIDSRLTRHLCAPFDLPDFLKQIREYIEAWYKEDERQIIIRTEVLEVGEQELADVAAGA